MSILYLVLSCENYLKTRCQWMLSTWLQKIPAGDDYLFLSSKGNHETKTIGFGTPDTYDAAPLKYLEFFRRAATPFFEYDWVFFCDDDTFVFPDRLHKLLSAYQSDQSVFVGRLLATAIGAPTPEGDLRPMALIHPAGGAGFAISRPLMHTLRKLLAVNDYDYKNILYGDVTFGWWLSFVKDSLIIDRSDLLKAQNPSHAENAGADPTSVATYHYCTEEDFRTLFKTMT